MRTIKFGQCLMMSLLAVATVACSISITEKELKAEDFGKSVETYRKAAEQGDAKAQHNLGVFYEDGTGGVAKDLTKAAEWYSKAAKQGDAKAQNNLGLLYTNGKGVAKDLTKAEEWYSKAVKQGVAEAQLNLGN